MKGTIITIGDEILLGQITDTNSAWLGNEMNLMGIDVVSMLTISDKKADIHNALDLSLAKSDVIVMTGGLGPTKDDITKHALAEYFDSGLTLDEALLAKIKGYFDKRDIPFLEAHEAQCYMPDKSTSLINNMGTAPGMLFEKDGRYILSMPGVPYEMKHIFSNSFAPHWQKINTSELIISHRTIRTVGIGESRIAETIDDIIQTLPEDISMSYLPSLGEVKLRLTARSAHDKTEVLDDYVAQISERIPSLIYGYGKMSLAEGLQRDLMAKGLTLSTAESCTGGYLAHKLTEVPGSSKYYMGSIVAYDYSPKKSLLGVTQHTLDEHGAVSEETVKEMLAGLLDRFGTDLGIAISGIAGPGGGMPTKPVGTIWMAYGSKTEVKTKKLSLAKDRLKNIQYTGIAGMNALRRFIM